MVNEGGLIWHDLRRTVATELRARQVHEYDIAGLLGHHTQAVTGTYARSTQDVLEDAVNKLALPRATNVIEFKRRLRATPSGTLGLSWTRGKDDENVKSSGKTWCRGWDSNPHGITPNGF